MKTRFLLKLHEFYTNKSTKLFVCLMTVLLLASSANAQEKIKFKGLVKDSTNQQKLAYAAISFTKVYPSKKAITQTLADTAGLFALDLDTGMYDISIQLIGYHKLAQKIRIDQQPTQVKTFLLQAQVHLLQQLNIVGKKPLISQQRDRLVYDVEQDPMAQSEALSEVMKRVPMLSMDGEGNIQLNGQRNYKVLLNGRETAMLAQNTTEALRGFPGAAVAKIEVITLPPAKYDAEGIGGLINIITKKAVVGYNGFVYAYYSNLNYQAGTNLNLRAGKFTLTGLYSLSGTYNNKANIHTTTQPLQTALFQQRNLIGQQNVDRFSNSGNFEMSYEIDSLQALIVYGNVGGGNNKSKLEQQIRTDFASSPSQYGLFSQNIRNSFPNYGIGSDFIKKFRSSREKELSFRFNAQFSKNDGLNNSLMAMSTSDLFRQNESYSNNKEYTLQTDFAQPFGSNLKLETGAKVILRHANSDYLSLSKNAEEQPYLPDYSNSDNFAYQQQVYGGYGSLTFSIQKINFRTGLRAEHTVIKGDFYSSATQVNQNYTSLVPDFLVNTQLGKNYTITLGYTKRLQRPYINTLNPFINNNDPLNISFGNPELGPQTIHTLSFQNRLLQGPNFFSLAFNASYSGDMIAQYATFDQATGISTTQYGNVGRNREVAALLSFSTNRKKFNGGVNATVRYNKVENTLVTSQHEEGFSGTVGIYFNVPIYRTFSISGSGGINRPSLTLVNSLRAIHYYQVNFGYKLFNQKLSATMNVNNFFNKWRTNKSFTNDVNFTTNTVSLTPFRAIYVGLTYNFGQLKEQQSKKKGVKNDDLINN